MFETKRKTSIKKSSERNFGIIFFLFFCLIGLWPILKSEKVNFIYLSIGIIFLILGLVTPKLLKYPNLIWYKFGIILGNIISPLIMFIIYFCLITPISFLMKIIHKDLINIKSDSNKNSYWITRKENQNNMKQQF